MKVECDLTPEERAQLIAEQAEGLLQRAAEDDVIDIESTVLRAILADLEAARKDAIEYKRMAIGEIEAGNRKRDLMANLWAALKALEKVRPANWDDDEDPDQAAAWKALDAALFGDTPEPIQQLLDEQQYWRANAAATIWMLRVSIAAMEDDPAKAPEDLPVHLRVNVLQPQVIALGNALAGDWDLHCSHDCGKLLRLGDAVFDYEDESPGHVDCAQPAMADPLPAGASRYQPCYSDPEEIARELEQAKAFLDAWCNGDEAEAGAGEPGQ